MRISVICGYVVLYVTQSCVPTTNIFEKNIFAWLHPCAVSSPSPYRPITFCLCVLHARDCKAMVQEVSLDAAVGASLSLVVSFEDYKNLMSGPTFCFVGVLPSF